MSDSSTRTFPEGSIIRIVILSLMLILPALSALVYAMYYFHVDDEGTRYRIVRQINKVYPMIEQFPPDTERAMAMLTKISHRDDLSPRETMAMHAAFAAVKMNMGDKEGAVADAKASLDTGKAWSDLEDQLEYITHYATASEKDLRARAQRLQDALPTSDEDISANDRAWKLYNVARAWMSVGEYQKALPFALQAMNEGKLDRQKYLVALVYTGLEQWGKARELLEELAWKDPENAYYMYWYWYVGRELDGLPKQEEPVFKPAPIFPHRAPGWGDKGVCAVRYDVTPAGSTSNWEVRCTRSKFEKAALSNVKKWKYSRIDPSQGTNRNGYVSGVGFQNYY